MEEDKYKWGKTCRWDGMWQRFVRPQIIILQNGYIQIYNPFIVAILIIFTWFLSLFLLQQLKSTIPLILYRIIHFIQRMKIVYYFLFVNLSLSINYF